MYVILAHHLFVVFPQKVPLSFQVITRITAPNPIIQTQQTVIHGRIRQPSWQKTRPIKRVDEPGLGFSVVEQSTHGGRSLGLDEEEEKPQTRRLKRRTGSRPIVLVDHVLEILVRGDGDQGVKVLTGELILESEGSAMEEGAGEAGAEVGKGGVAVDDDDSGVAADVAEGLVVGTGDDVTAIAAHEAELGAGDRWQMVVHPRVGIAGARRRVDGVRVVELDGGSRSGGRRSHCCGGGGGGGGGGG